MIFGDISLGRRKNLLKYNLTEFENHSPLISKKSHAVSSLIPLIIYHLNLSCWEVTEGKLQHCFLFLSYPFTENYIKDRSELLRINATLFLKKLFKKMDYLTRPQDIF